MNRSQMSVGDTTLDRYECTNPAETAVVLARRAPQQGALLAKGTLIQQLDLSKIMRKIQGKEGWDDARTKSAEMKYRQFLFMGLKYPGVPMVPDKDIDEVWHAHILDTKKYRMDCKAIFGRFIDHVPNYGVHTPGDNTAVQTFNALWSHEFGVSLFEGVRSCQSMGDEQVLPYKGPAAEQVNCSVCVGQCDGDSRAPQPWSPDNHITDAPYVKSVAPVGATNDCLSNCSGCRTDCVGTQ